MLCKILETSNDDPYSIQFISLFIDPLQGVNHKDVENSHRIHQNIQSLS